MDDLEAQIGQINKQLGVLSLEHRYMGLLMTTPGSRARRSSSGTPGFVRVSISLVTVTAAAR